jgi:endoglucanase
MIPWSRLPHRASLAAVALLALGGCLAEAAGEDGGVVDDADDALSSPACVVTYDVISTTASSFTAKITIQNTSSSAYKAWKLGFSFPNAQKISTVTGGNATQTGSAVTVTNTSSNGVVSIGATASFKMTASRGSVNGVPAAFSVNGAACARRTVSGGGTGGASSAGSGSSGVTTP